MGGIRYYLEKGTKMVGKRYGKVHKFHKNTFKNLHISKKSSNFVHKIQSQQAKRNTIIMCMFTLKLNDELVQRTRLSFANETDMTAWLQRQVEALMIEYNTTQQTVRRNARAAIAAMRRTSELNGNSEMTLEDINNEIQQARQARKATK